MSTRSNLALAASVLAVSLLAGASANARGGSSSAGDAYLNDAQRNPRFIEPGGDYLPSRYRSSHPSEGYYDRQASQGYRPGYRGRVTVSPYGY